MSTAAAPACPNCPGRYAWHPGRCVQGVGTCARAACGRRFTYSRSRHSRGKKYCSRDCQWVAMREQPPASLAKALRASADARRGKGGTCREPGCSAPHHARGACGRHYQARRRQAS